MTRAVAIETTLHQDLRLSIGDAGPRMTPGDHGEIVRLAPHHMVVDARDVLAVEAAFAKAQEIDAMIAGLASDPDIDIATRQRIAARAQRVHDAIATRLDGAKA